MSSPKYLSDIKESAELPKRIKLVRKTLSLTQHQFADGIGTSQSYVSDLEKGKKLPSDTFLVALSQTYRINRGWLAMGEGEIFEKQESLLEGLATEQMPVLKTIAKTPEGASDEVLGYVVLPEMPPGCFAMQVVGGQMEPTLCNGDTVVVQKDAEYAPGDVMLLINPWNELILRRYREIEGKAVMTPDNADYRPFILESREYLIGKVISAWRKISF